MIKSRKATQVSVLWLHLIGALSCISFAIVIALAPNISRHQDDFSVAVLLLIGMVVILVGTTIYSVYKQRRSDDSV